MSTKTDFNPGDWHLLTRAPLEIWRGLAGVDLLVQSSRAEAAAFNKASVDARARFAGNELVQAVLDDMHPLSLGADPGVVAVDRILADLAGVADALDGECEPGEANEFKRFLLWLGDLIARASGEGIVDTHLRVSQKEQKLLRDMRESLRYRP
jgi:hypothetical protein